MLLFPLAHPNVFPARSAPFHRPWPAAMCEVPLGLRAAETSGFSSTAGQAAARLLPEMLFSAAFVERCRCSADPLDHSLRVPVPSPFPCCHPVR